MRITRTLPFTIQSRLHSDVLNIMENSQFSFDSALIFSMHSSVVAANTFTIHQCIWPHLHRPQRFMQSARRTAISGYNSSRCSSSKALIKLLSHISTTTIPMPIFITTIQFDNTFIHYEENARICQIDRCGRSMNEGFRPINVDFSAGNMGGIIGCKKCYKLGNL